MSAREKSDLSEVAEKRANKAASAAAELVERRGGTKENAELQSTVRTQSRAAARELVRGETAHDGANIRSRSTQPNRNRKRSPSSQAGAGSNSEMPEAWYQGRG